MPNNNNNVSSAKGVKGGYVFCAALGTDLPTDYKTPLSEDWKALGFITDEGYKESRDSDVDDRVDMNGDLMDSQKTSQVESAQVTLAEIKADTLRAQYGEANVTDENGIIVVKHNSEDEMIQSYVLDLVLKNNRRWRKVVPMGSSADLDTLAISVSELAARSLTIKYLTDEAGQTCYDYIQSTETTETTEG